MKESEINVIKLQEAISKNKLVIFAGAGISVDSDIPDWSKLIQDLKDELGITNDENDYLKIPQYYFNERGEKEYIEKVRSILKHNTQTYNLLHEKIFDLNPEHILTTNFDNLLEQVIESNSHPFSIIRRDNDFPYSENTKYLVKVHGDLGENDFVLKENDYLNYSINHPLIEAFLKSVFATRTVLFVGYSLNDTNLKQILHQVQNILGNDFQNAYIINNKEINSYTRNYFKSQGVNIITIKEVYTDDLDFDIKGYEKLGDRGKSLFKILHKIKNTDIKKIDITNDNIVDIFYDSLKKLDKNLIYSTKEIASLEIFKEEYSVFKYFKNLYLTKDYFKFFFEDLFTINNDIIHLNNSLENIKALTEKEQIELCSKIEFIVNSLNKNCIIYVSTIYKSINISIKHNERCFCMNCLIDNAEFDLLNKEFEKRNINEGTNVTEDIQLAFAKYRIGCYHDAYNLFSQVSTKAWKRKEFIYYYISKRNIKYLRNLIKWGVSEHKFILNDIDKIDLDKLSIEINDISDLNQKFIYNIQDERYLNYCYELILNQYQELTKQQISIQSNKHITNFNYIEKLKITRNILFTIHRFYSRNKIVIDAYTDYKKIFKTSLDIYSITYSSLNSMNNNDKVKVFDSYSLNLFFSNLNSIDISKSIDKFGLKKIEITDETLVIEKIERIIKNFDEYPTGINSFNDFRLNALLNCLLFYNYFNTAYDNIIFRDLINHYLNYYNYIDQDQISRILYKYINELNEYNLKEFYDLFLDKNVEFLEIISILFAKKKIILEDKMINELLIIFENKKDFDFSHLYNSSSGNAKTKVKRIIKKQLDKSFDIDLFFNYSLLNIINYKIYFKKYLERIKSFADINFYDLGLEERFFTEDIQFYNLILFILEKDLKEKHFDDLKEKSDILLFYLNRENVQGNKFNIEFIRYFKNDNFIMSKIFQYKNIIDLATIYIKNNKTDNEITKLYIKYIL